MARRVPPSRLSATYRCFSMACIDRPCLEFGDKIIMSQSAFRKAHNLKLRLPLLFKVSNPSGGGVNGPAPSQFCGVLEFSAPEDQAFLPYWMMQNLLIPEGARVELVSITRPPPGSFVRFRPHNPAFLDLAMKQGPKALMEGALRHYSVLCEGETILIQHENQRFHLDVVESRPATATLAAERFPSVGTDLEVGTAEEGVVRTARVAPFAEFGVDQERKERGATGGAGSLESRPAGGLISLLGNVDLEVEFCTAREENSSTTAELTSFMSPPNAKRHEAGGRGEGGSCTGGSTRGSSSRGRGCWGGHNLPAPAKANGLEPSESKPQGYSGHICTPITRYSQPCRRNCVAFSGAGVTLGSKGEGKEGNTSSIVGLGKQEGRSMDTSAPVAPHHGSRELKIGGGAGCDARSRSHDEATVPTSTKQSRSVSTSDNYGGGGEEIHDMVCESAGSFKKDTEVFEHNEGRDMCGHNIDSMCGACESCGRMVPQMNRHLHILRCPGAASRFAQAYSSIAENTEMGPIKTASPLCGGRGWKQGNVDKGGLANTTVSIPGEAWGQQARDINEEDAGVRVFPEGSGCRSVDKGDDSGRAISCSFCGLLFSTVGGEGGRDEHERLCGARTELCNQCGMFILRRDKVAHLTGGICKVPPANRGIHRGAAVLGKGREGFGGLGWGAGGGQDGERTVGGFHSEGVGAGRMFRIGGEEGIVEALLAEAKRSSVEASAALVGARTRNDSLARVVGMRTGASSYDLAGAWAQEGVGIEAGEGPKFEARGENGDRANPMVSATEQNGSTLHSHALEMDRKEEMTDSGRGNGQDRARHMGKVTGMCRGQDRGGRCVDPGLLVGQRLLTSECGVATTAAMLQAVATASVAGIGEEGEWCLCSGCGGLLPDIEQLQVHTLMNCPVLSASLMDERGVSDGSVERGDKDESGSGSLEGRQWANSLGAVATKTSEAALHGHTDKGTEMSEGSQVKDVGWMCKHCTLLNPEHIVICKACDQARSKGLNPPERVSDADRARKGSGRQWKGDGRSGRLEGEQVLVQGTGIGPEPDSSAAPRTSVSSHPQAVSDAPHTIQPLRPPQLSPTTTTDQLATTESTREKKSVQSLPRRPRARHSSLGPARRAFRAEELGAKEGGASGGGLPACRNLRLVGSSTGANDTASPQGPAVCGGVGIYTPCSMKRRRATGQAHMNMREEVGGARSRENSGPGAVRVGLVGGACVRVGKGEEGVGGSHEDKEKDRRRGEASSPSVLMMGCGGTGGNGQSISRGRPGKSVPEKLRRCVGISRNILTLAEGSVAPQATGRYGGRGKTRLSQTQVVP